ncbi:G-protein-signaling modulator 2-like isoform X3 [Branchiostoma floridae x Branchiostoma belcheri]
MTMDASCMELALEGERLCKAGDCRAGVSFFESAVQVGTEDLKTLSAIYSQLGNAYFYLQEYEKALEYHRHDLTLARTLSDRLGEAKASGNLGNTLKVLGKFDEAIVCCQRHLDISRELADKVGEARALYNLGNVYHAKGKHAGRNSQHDPGDFPEDVKASLQKATEFYEANLTIVKELGDRAAQGRACGNLGNTHYLLGNFSRAIMFHEERLAIAKEFGDKAAERRAYSNLGNAHIFLGEFETAAEYYKRTFSCRKTLQIATQLGDRAIEAQACYSLGNTYTLLRDYEKAVEYHLRHLQIAQDLGDRVGEGRACWSLGNAHTALGNHEKALHFAQRHLEISREVQDKTGEVTAQMNVNDLRTVLGITQDHNQSAHTSSSHLASNGPSVSLLPDSAIASVNSSIISTQSKVRMRRESMEKMDLMALSPDKYSTTNGSTTTSESEQSVKLKAKPPRAKVRLNGASEPRKQPSASGSSTSVSSSVDMQDIQLQMPAGSRKNSEDALDEGFFDILTRLQSRRMDDQRCELKPISKTPSIASSRSSQSSRTTTEDKSNINPQSDEFLDMVAGVQGRRLNEQRAAPLADLPGLNKKSKAVIGQLLATNEQAVPDDDFFDMLMRCQGSRIEDQRSSPPVANAPTVPDEDFFSLIQRMQSSRLEEQRSTLPNPTPRKDSDTKPKS